MSNTSTTALAILPRAEDSSHFALDALVDDALNSSSGFYPRSGLWRSARASAGPLSLAPLTTRVPRAEARPLFSARSLEIVLATLVLTLLVSVSAVGLAMTRASAPAAGQLALGAPEPTPAAAFMMIPFAERDEEPPTDLIVELEPKATKTVRRTTTRKPAISGKPAAKPKAPVVAKAPASDPHAGLSVECILDPASCDSPKSGSKAPAPATKSTTGKEKLTTADIRTAMAPVKANAKRCAALGAVSGDKVSVKLSVDGATGRVRSATPLAPFNNAVGQCVADALDEAVFPAVDKVATGIVYSVTM